MDDALGNLVRFVLLPGQRFDTVGVPPLIEGLAFDALIADKAFDSNAIIAELDARGAFGHAARSNLLGQKRPVGLASSLEVLKRKLDWYTFHRRSQHLKVRVPSGTRSSDVFIIGDSKRQ